MPNNIRDEIIDRLREAFESARDNPPAVSGKPVQLVSVMERFTLPTDLDVRQGFASSVVWIWRFTTGRRRIHTGRRKHLFGVCVPDRARVGGHGLIGVGIGNGGNDTADCA